ncbi:MAG TPA: LLM class flavin-dependent oxidoreductase [Actinomycetes bacterium]|nr:LLM class flavin-dependent oxidoreductase [Actinomycetes bacterium]
MDLGFALPHYDFSFPDSGQSGAGAARTEPRASAGQGTGGPAPTASPVPGRVAGVGAPASPALGPVTFERVAGYAERAEAAGFAELWVSDHFWSDLSRYGGSPGRQGTLECWSMLSALAMRTRRVRLGSLVLAAGFRPPGLLAKMAATLDQLCGGRLDLGLGAGWNEDEFLANDLPFPRPGERLAMLEECLDILRLMLTDSGTPASFHGNHYRIDNAPVIPTPVQRPRPPLWVGGSGDRMLGVIARAADGWNVCWAITPEHYDQRLEVLRAACDRAGRPLEDVRRSIGLATLIGRDADDLAERWRRLQAWAPGGALDGVELAEWAAPRLVGTPDEILEQLRGWRDRGVEQIVCSFSNVPFAIFEDEQLDLLAELVLPRLA